MLLITHKEVIFQYHFSLDTVAPFVYNNKELLILEGIELTLQNQHEIREILEAVVKVQVATQEAQNSADLKQIQQTQNQLKQVQQKLHEAQGKATK